MVLSVLWCPAFGQLNDDEQLFAVPSEITIDLNLDVNLNNSFTIVDEFASRTDAEKFASYTYLANHLTQDFPDDQSKVRSIYTWIALNISYDQESFNGGIKRDQSADIVWDRKMAVCEGYANLFNEMCDIVGIESRIVKGYVKNFIAGDLKFPNHAWNSVKIDGKWKLLDVTWASVNNEGILLANNNLKESYTWHKLNYFFLVNPTRMILTHLPEDPYWQLQNNWIDIETFDLGEENIRLALSNPYKEAKDFESLIEVYERLDSLDKSISYLERMEKNKLNRVKEYGLGVAYYYKAQKILKESMPSKRYEANRLAKSYFEKSLDQLAALQEEDYGYDFSKELANSVSFRLETLQ